MWGGLAIKSVLKEGPWFTCVYVCVYVFVCKCCVARRGRDTYQIPTYSTHLPNQARGSSISSTPYPRPRQSHLTLPWREAGHSLTQIDRSVGPSASHLVDTTPGPYASGTVSIQRPQVGR